MIVDDIEKQQAKITAALMMWFFGFSFVLIGLLFGFLFEVYLLFIIAGVGVLLFFIGIFLVRSAKDIGVLDWFKMNSWETTDRCPKCGKFLKIKNIVVCPYCGEGVHSGGSKTRKNIKMKDGVPHCPNCNAQVENDLNFCPYCGIEF